MIMMFIVFFLLLQQVLQDVGIVSCVDGNVLLLDSGLCLILYVMVVYVCDNGGWQIFIVVESQYSWLFVDGLFEYQYVNGIDEQVLLLVGFQGWVWVDLVILQIVIGVEDVQGLLMMGLIYLVGDDGQEYECIVVLGLLVYYCEYEVDVSSCSEDDYGFCLCCLFIRSMDVFDELLKVCLFLVICLFVLCDVDGLCEVDCWVNGYDFVVVLFLLCVYVVSWLQVGLEFCKQYVVICIGLFG